MKQEHVISIRNLTKIYNGHTVGIEDLSLEITKGEIFGFLGQNGAGKTTTIRCVLNILLPTNGTCFVKGVEVTRDTPFLRDEIGYLPGEISVPKNYTVKGFLAYINSLRKKDPSRLDEVVRRFDIPMNKKIGQLSKGNKQKLGIAIAFMNDPEILILDEPSSGLDPLFQQELYDLILEEKARGKTIFFSSHNLDEVQKICDRVAIIREGKLVTVEKVDGLAEKIPRTLKAKVDPANRDKLMASSFAGHIRTFNEDGELEIQISNGDSLAKIMSTLSGMGLQDMSYPPASLEQYFLSKYKGE